MLSANLFMRLPDSATLLILSSLFLTAHGNAVPRQTKTVPLRELDVLPWPLPTPMPGSDSEANLLGRQLNTVCGYIGGDPDLPATCSAGSHCAVDVDHSAIGCCPDNGGCTAGLYTGCVDRNSDAQTEINPYVYTCGGGDVCYQNTFEGGFFQYGCGSSSNVAGTVVATASGRDAVVMSSISVDLTAEVTSLTEPTTLGTRDSTSESESSTTEITSTGTEDASSTRSEPSATSTEADPDAPDNDDGGTNVGAIVGGTIGGVAFLALLALVALYFLRRRNHNLREGPQNQGKQYISPEDEGNGAFAPLPTVQDVGDHHPPRGVPQAYSGAGDYMAQDPYGYNTEPYAATGQYGYSSPTHPNTVLGGGTMMEHDRQPLTEDPDYASNGSTNYHGALRAIQEEERESPVIPGTEATHTYIPRRDGGGSLWQSNRGTSNTRNPMWL